MKYRTYRLNSEGITRKLLKHGVIKVKKKASALERIRVGMNYIYSSGMVELSSMEVVIHAEEMLWLKSDKVIYFPIDKGMAEALMQGTYSVKNEAAFYTEPESFILNLPEGLSFNGNSNGSGLLVTVVPHDDRAGAIYHNFMDWIDRPRVNVESDNKDGSFTITITYQDTHDEKVGVYSRIAVPSENAVKVLQMTTVEEFTAYMRETNSFDKYKNKIPLSDDEMAYQFEVMRFVCGFMVYKKALPQRVIQGLPALHSKQVSTPYTKDAKPMLIKHPQAGRDSYKGHYRSWHFRQLMNERFYHGEHANKKRGSRVIFVSDSYVIDDIEAKTVVG